MLKANGLEDLIEEEAEHERYRFGNGGLLDSFTRARVPGVLCGKAYMLEFSVVPSERLTLLLGRDLLEHLRAKLDIHRRELRIGSGTSRLEDSMAGHFAVNLRPESWMALQSASNYFQEDMELPRRLQDRPRDQPHRPHVNETSRSQKPGRTLLQRCMAYVTPMLAMASAQCCPSSVAQTIPSPSQVTTEAAAEI